MTTKTKKPKPVLKAWLVPPKGPIQQIELPDDDHVLIAVSDQYFRERPYTGMVTLTAVDVRRLPEEISKAIMGDSDLPSQWTHFSVDDNGLLIPEIRQQLNPRMTYAYGTGHPIVGHAVVYEKELD